MAGQYNFAIKVGLALYPTATPAIVPFTIYINPCIVTSFVPPTDYTWNYAVGNNAVNYLFNFI